MNAEQFANLREAQVKVEVVSVTELEHQGRDRTLLYGYTGDRDTFHVYLKDRKICVTAYKNHYGREPDEVRLTASDDHLKFYNIPSGHVYPSACDEQFCRLLLSKGYSLSFRSFEEREEKPFHGKLIEDLSEAR